MRKKGLGSEKKVAKAPPQKIPAFHRKRRGQEGKGRKRENWTGGNGQRKGTEPGGGKRV